MWLTGKRRNPTITYSILNSKPLILFDQVQFQKSLKLKLIEGLDKIKNGQFIWRGKGILKLFTSKWEILYVDSEILIIQFGSTLVTSAGMDILVSDPQDAKYYKNEVKRFPELYNLNGGDIEKLGWLF